MPESKEKNRTFNFQRDLNLALSVAASVAQPLERPQQSTNLFQLGSIGQVPDCLSSVIRLMSVPPLVPSLSRAPHAQKN